MTAPGWAEEAEKLIVPLRWREPHASVKYPEWFAYNAALRFEARIDTSRAICFGKFPLRINGTDCGQKFETLEDAKAYAKLAYISRAKEVIDLAELSRLCVSREEFERLKTALENINRKASPDPERTMGEASNDLYWCACEARAALKDQSHD